MTLENENGKKGLPSLGKVIRNGWGRSLVWFDWLFHPEGPPFAKTIFNFLYMIGGLVIGLVGLFMLIDNFSLNCFGQGSNQSCTLLKFFPFKYIVGQPTNIDHIRYIGAGLLFIGATFFIVGKHPGRVEQKTAVYNEEIDNLICDIKPYLNVLPEPEQKRAECEINKLKFFKEKPSEVSIQNLTCLRKIQVDTYDDITLKAKANQDLLDYKYIIGEEHDNYKKYEFIINDLIRRKETVDLKAHLKPLREEIDSEKFLAGHGEAILGSLKWWFSPAVFSMGFIGITPLLHEPYFEDHLSIIHWAFLGITGAILYTVNHIRNMDTIKLGEDEGNTILYRMILGMVIGAFAAILLFSSVRSGIFGGKALPKLFEPGEEKIEVVNALSVFWGIAAGFSAKLLEGLLGSSEKVTLK